MSAIDWDTKLAGKNTEDAWITFRQLVKNSVLENVPTRKASKKLKKNPWMTRSTRRKLQRRDKAWKKYRTIPVDANYLEYKRLRNEANKQVKQDQANYRKTILKSFKGKRNVSMDICRN